MLELRALDADVDRLRLGGLELRLGLGHVRARGRAGRIFVAGDLERARIAVGRIFEQILELVLHAKLEIGGGKGGLRREARRGEVAGTRLSIRDIALDGAANAPPDVDVPSSAERELV